MTASSPLSPSTDVHRPAFHLTPVATWMNDPNGLIRHDDVWHAFFQENPFGSTHANLSWGHAVSRDLATWENLPVALPCSETEQIFSGSAVHDAQNSSGLGAEGGPGPLVAIYTSAYAPDHATHPGIQAQSLAFSEDGGATWTYAADNPVLDRGSSDFRDPKVFLHAETGRWVMIAVEALDQKVMIHTSENLRDWELASEFAFPDIDGGVWECPDLVRVPGPDGDPVWVLILSTNPGGPAGGSGTWTLIGDFDGRTFTTSARPAPLDLGQDNYAAVSFSGVEGRPVILGWMNNWDYAQHTPTGPWRSSMTLPRELDVVPGADGRLELRGRLRVPAAIPAIDVSVPAEPGPVGEVRVPSTEPFLLQGTLRTDAAHRIVLRFGTEPAAPELVVEVDGEGSITLDRGAAHRQEFAPAFARSLPYQPAAPGDPVAFRLVVDRSTVELELEDGRAVISQQIFPGGGEVTLRVDPPR
ncbi:GH32 C-terminal domain-containing protein [Brachybacterium hainanense]|uniref:GH32 C-terminal domain-containing protein n=1 Tax=Brachybacterium hainanense TaxID=1541174 RepID=A0ABV6RGH2_9MICO